LNNEVTHLTGKKPAMAIQAKAVSSKPSTPYSRPVGVKEKNPFQRKCSTSPVNSKVERPNLVFESSPS